MRVLLDTHALLWALAEPRLLSKRGFALLRDPANVLLVSAVSAWEIATKYRLGKLSQAGPILAGYASHLEVLRAEELPMNSAHALKAGEFATAHRDPFDRMLAAQAIIEGLPLVTDDPAFDCFADLQTVW